MPSNAKANPDDIDIVSLWGAVRRGLPRLLVLTFGAGILTYATLSTMALRYTSEAQRHPPRHESVPDGREDRRRRQRHAEDEGGDQYPGEALLSTDLLLKVASKLKLATARVQSRAGGLGLFANHRLLRLSKIRAGNGRQPSAIVTRQLEITSPGNRASAFAFPRPIRSCRHSPTGWPGL
jgi:uncharacterized protein involved in exopolysaccharide biosynthesis